MSRPVYTVSAVRQPEDMEPGWWAVAYQTPDGQTEHIFPHVALHWRAAEYGIDPADSRTLLQVVMYEPHMHGHGAHSPDFLYRTDQETARLGHLARVQRLQAETLRIDDPQGLLEAIHAAHVVDHFDHMVRCNTVLAHRTGVHMPHYSMNRG